MPNAPQNNTVTIEDARLIFRNFAGKEGMYNREGDRNFGVLLNDEDAEKLLQDGWAVKFLKLREDDPPEATPQAYLSVKVSYKGRPPRIVMISSKNRLELTEDVIDQLDFVDVQKADLILNPYEWNVSGKSGIKAYVKTMFVTIFEDELELKYADDDTLPTRSGRTDEGDE